MPRLQELNLVKTQVSGEGLRQLANAKHLKRLYIDHQIVTADSQPILNLPERIEVVAETP
ncbi:MAG: hypothetical protein R3C05_22205 [Pirellulaceae bacterium]